jgi:hypothetical protein
VTYLTGSTIACVGIGGGGGGGWASAAAAQATTAAGGGASAAPRKGSVQFSYLLTRSCRYELEMINFCGGVVEMGEGMDVGG